MSTIAVSKETISELKRLKKHFEVKNYDELIKLLIKDIKAKKMEEAWEALRLEQEEAEKMKNILEEKRRTWWKRSY